MQSNIPLRVTPLTSTPTSTAAPPFTARPAGTARVPSYSQTRCYEKFKEYDAPVANLWYMTRLDGPLDIERLEAALHRIISRHEVLRSSFHSTSDGVSMRLNDLADMQIIRHFDFSGMSATRSYQRIRNIVEATAAHKIDIEQAPLFRVHLYKQSPVCHTLFLMVDHIIFDGWSFGVFLADINREYNSNGKAPQHNAQERSRSALQFSDFAHNERTWLESAAGVRAMEYWIRQLHGSQACARLPVARAKTMQAAKSGQYGSRTDKRVAHTIAPETSDAIRRFTKEVSCSPASLFLSVINTWLAHTCDNPDVVIASAISNRTARKSFSIMGPCFNVVALRNRVERATLFREHIRQTAKTIKEAKQNQSVPFSVIVDEFNKRGQSLVYDVGFAFQNVPLPPLALEQLRSTPVDFDLGAGVCELLFYVMDANVFTAKEKAFVINLHYNSQSYSEVEAQIICEHIELMLANATKDGSITSHQLMELVPQQSIRS